MSLISPQTPAEWDWFFSDGDPTGMKDFQKQFYADGIYPFNSKEYYGHQIDYLEDYAVTKFNHLWITAIQYTHVGGYCSFNAEGYAICDYRNDFVWVDYASDLDLTKRDQTKSVGDSGFYWRSQHFIEYEFKKQQKYQSSSYIMWLHKQRSKIKPNYTRCGRFAGVIRRIIEG